MSIRVLDHQEVEGGERSIDCLEIVDPDTNDRSERWQFVCELCQEFRSDLTEQEARGAFANHACRVLRDYGD